MNSASSCDSVVSINSGFSEDSMEHLSAEERATIMLLEETINLLEAEEDSGVSNDEPDDEFQERSVHEDANKVSGKDHKVHNIGGVPTPLLLANGNARSLKQTVVSNTPEQKAVPLVNEITSSSPNSHHSSTNRPAPSPSNSKTPVATGDTSDELSDMPPSFIPDPPVKGGISKESTTKDGPFKSQLESGMDLKQKDASLMDYIPPPENFMDEPEPSLTGPPPPSQPQVKPDSQSQPLAQTQPQPQPQTQPQSNPQPSSQPQAQVHPQTQTQQSPAQSKSEPTPDSITIAPPPGFGGPAEDAKPQTTANTSPGGTLSAGELNDLRKRASQKKIQSPAQKVGDEAGLSPNSPFEDHSEPKSPPAVAPKPKKLPPNIILKSQKDSGPGHSLISAERSKNNPQNIHKEALKKLGLLKDDEPDSGPAFSHMQRIPPPAAFNTNPTSPPGDAPHVPAVSQGKSVAFVPATSHLEKGGRESPPLARRQSSKNFEIKPASSDVGLKSITVERSNFAAARDKSHEKTSVELSPGQLRKRSTSESTRKDTNSNKEPEFRRSLRTSAAPPQQGTDSQKLPRSHGISVVISPQSAKGEDRKQALKRLGLIKD